MSRIRIADRDGDIVEIIAQGKSGEITVIAEMTRSDDDLILRDAHIDGVGPGASSIGELKQLAREFAQQQGASRIIIYGGVRTTGAKPGRRPRPIIIDVN